MKKRESRTPKSKQREKKLFKYLWVEKKKKENFGYSTFNEMLYVFIRQKSFFLVQTFLRGINLEAF